MAKDHSISDTTLSRFADLDGAQRRVREVHDHHRSTTPEPIGEVKWPAWKVTVFVLAFCGAFWGGVIWLAVRLLG